MIIYVQNLSRFLVPTQKKLLQTEHILGKREINFRRFNFERPIFKLFARARIKKDNLLLRVATRSFEGHSTCLWLVNKKRILQPWAETLKILSSSQKLG